MSPPAAPPPDAPVAALLRPRSIAAVGASGRPDAYAISAGQEIATTAAKELLLTGDDKVTAERALAMGIVDRVVPPDRLMASATGIARDIAAAAPLSVRLTERAINRTHEVMGMRQALLAALETDILIEASEGPEHAEFNRMRTEQGLQAAIAWRDARFGRKRGS